MLNHARLANDCQRKITALLPNKHITMSIYMPTEATENTILEFWFGNADNQPAAENKKSRWYLSTAK
jgi:hypothetical protein